MCIFVLETRFVPGLSCISTGKVSSGFTVNGIESDELGEKDSVTVFSALLLFSILFCTRKIVVTRPTIAITARLNLKNGCFIYRK